MSRLSLKPSEYWARQCHVGSSFIRPARGRRCATRSASTASCGAATSRTARAAGRTRHEHLRLAFAGVAGDEVHGDGRRQRGRLYGFDLDALGAGRGAGRPDRRRGRPAARARRDPRRGAALPGLRAAAAAEPSEGGARMSTSPLRRPHAGAAAQPRGRGHVGRRVGHVARRRLRDRPRRRRRGAAAAARADGRAARAGHRSRPVDLGARAAAVRRRLVRGAGAATRAPSATTRCVMPMTTEQSVIGGRETFGEPKKLGRGRPRPRRRPGAGHRSPGSARRSSRSTGTRRSTTLDRPPTARAPTSTSSSCSRPTARASTPSRALVYCHRDETTREARARRRRGRSCASRGSTRWPTFRCGGSSSITLAERRSVQRGEIVEPGARRVAAPVRAPALRRPLAPSATTVTCDDLDGQGRGRHRRRQRRRPGDGRALRRARA